MTLRRSKTDPEGQGRKRRPTWRAWVIFDKRSSRDNTTCEGWAGLTPAKLKLAIGRRWRLEHPWGSAWDTCVDAMLRRFNRTEVPPLEQLRPEYPHRLSLSQRISLHQNYLDHSYCIKPVYL